MPTKSSAPGTTSLRISKLNAIPLLHLTQLYKETETKCNPKGILTDCTTIRNELHSPNYAHLFSIFGGRCKVCITTQYCSVFSCKAVSCSAVACGARTLKLTRMLSNPTGASFEIPSVP